MHRSDSVSGTERQEESPSAGNSNRVDRGLTRAQRIVQSSVIRDAFDRGRNFPGRVIVMWVRGGEGAAMRLGVVTGARTLPRAVDRNRARRMMREVFRLNRDRFSGAYDVVLVARRGAATASIAEMEKDLLLLAGRAGILTAK